MRQPTRMSRSLALTASLMAAVAHVATAQDTPAPSVSPSLVASDAVLVTQTVIEHAQEGLGFIVRHRQSLGLAGERGGEK